MFVEVVYETGASSVMQVADKEEALAAMAEQHRRAKSGLLNGPQGGQAERVAQAFIYDRHPGDFNVGGTLSVDELKETLPTMVDDLADDNGVVAVGVFAENVRALTHPMVMEREPHDSMFRMEHTDVITTSEVESGSEESPEV